MPGGHHHTRLVVKAIAKKGLTEDTQAKRAAKSNTHTDTSTKGPSCCARPCFCLGRSVRLLCVGRGSLPMLDLRTGDLALFARNRNILRILPGVGPVVIHPQASPDAHLCCGSTLHTMTGARGYHSSSSSSFSCAASPTAAVVVAACLPLLFAICRLLSLYTYIYFRCDMRNS